MKHKRGEPQVRRGKWTLEEELYTSKMITLFNQGLLPILSGTTLRSYLSSQLQCNPMRVTKKFAGQSCIGKQIFQPCDDTKYNIELMKRGTEELNKLENNFRCRSKGKKMSKRRRAFGRDDANDSKSNSTIYSKQDNNVSGNSSNSTDYDEEDEYDDDEDDDEDDESNDYDINESKFPEDRESPYYKTVPRRNLRINRNSSESPKESIFTRLNEDLSFQTVSAMGMTMEYENYVKDVDAACDLLLQFSQKVKSDEQL